MIHTIHHKKNELFEVEFYKDKRCTQAFDFTGKTHLYLQADIEILLVLLATHQVDPEAEIFVPRLPNSWHELSLQDNISNKIKTLDDITSNLSKYIPEDSAVLFLSEEDFNKGYIPYLSSFIYPRLEKETQSIKENGIDDVDCITDHKKLTIFVPELTSKNPSKINNTAKELKEKYGVEEVSLFVLHCFIEKKHIIKTLRPSKADKMYNNEIYGYEMQKICKNINKIITTNSTGILPVQDNEHLQVIDCKEIFEEYLKTQI